MLSREAYLMGRDKAAPLNAELERNCALLLPAVNGLLLEYGSTPAVSSGYRPPAINAATPGAAKRSNHMRCLAVDFADPAGRLDKWCLANLERLAHWGLFLEDPDSTPGWCHLQCIEPKSKRRVFLP